MNLLRALPLLALAFLTPALAEPIPEMQESSMGFRSFDLPEQTGSFEVFFDATPLANKIDVFTGVSTMPARQATDVAAIVRFNDQGTIDARNGNGFKADQKLAYSANKVYRVRMVINVPTRTYSVFVTPAGEAEVALASNYGFRIQQNSVKSLGQIVLAGFKGSDGFFAGAHRVTGVVVKTAP